MTRPVITSCWWLRPLVARAAGCSLPQVIQCNANHRDWARDFLHAVVVTVLNLRPEDADVLEPVLAEASPALQKDFVQPAEAFVFQFQQEVRWRQQGPRGRAPC